MARIETVEQLRAVLPMPRETTKSKILDALDDQAQAFIARSAYLLLATTDDAGTLEVSPKGDEPGFVRVEDARTLLMPERAGNNLAIGLQNILANGRVGMIFLRPPTGETLRVSGRAEIHDDAELRARLGSAGRPALLAIRIHVERCYFHCARATLRSQLWNPQAWGEAQKVSFGRIIAARAGGDATTAEQIDQRIATGYATRLWTND
jgi:PPOX class probable FMN-dependent enzyme